MEKSKPKAVLLNDLHFNINNLKVASEVLYRGLLCSIGLQVPLIIAGDLNDTKNIIRAECANEILRILNNRPQDHRVIILVGNHDLINQNGREHSLNFLNSTAEVVSFPWYDISLGIQFIPYQSTNELFMEAFNNRQSDLIVAHTGLKGAFMGEYIKDESSIDPEAIKGVRIISGHYHRKQDIGNFSFLGTQYTTSFAEAHDGPKGANILNSDYSLTLVPYSDIRKHVVIERTIQTVFDPIDNLNSNDLLYLKIKGSSQELDALSKKALGDKHLGHQNFKLDKVYPTASLRYREINKLDDSALLIELINSKADNKDHADFLLDLIKEVLS